MADYPLRSATYHCLGELLSHQLANTPRVHPEALAQRPAFKQEPCGSCCYTVLASVSRCYPLLLGRLPTCYSPVRHSVGSKIILVQALRINWATSFDLHVLGTPPTFVLSQDQTLTLKMRTLLALIHLFLQIDIAYLFNF